MLTFPWPPPETTYLPREWGTRLRPFTWSIQITWRATISQKAHLFQSTFSTPVKEVKAVLCKAVSHCPVTGKTDTPRGSGSPLGGGGPLGPHSGDHLPADVAVAGSPCCPSLAPAKRLAGLPLRPPAALENVRKEKKVNKENHGGEEDPAATRRGRTGPPHQAPPPALTTHRPGEMAAGGTGPPAAHPLDDRTLPPPPGQGEGGIPIPSRARRGRRSCHSLEPGPRLRGREPWPRAEGTSAGPGAMAPAPP